MLQVQDREEEKKSRRTEEICFLEHVRERPKDDGEFIDGKPIYEAINLSG